MYTGYARQVQDCQTKRQHRLFHEKMGVYFCARRPTAVNTGRKGDNVWAGAAAFAYASYLKEGRGAVMIKRMPRPEDERMPFDQPDDFFLYAPKDVLGNVFPNCHAGAIDRYNPETEMILLVLDTVKSGTCLKLTGQNMGITPMEAVARKDGRKEIKPGQLLKLARPVEGLSDGAYLYLGRNGAWLNLRPAGKGQGTAQNRRQTVRVHCDFESCFEIAPDDKISPQEQPAD